MIFTKQLIVIQNYSANMLRYNPCGCLVKSRTLMCSSNKKTTKQFKSTEFEFKMPDKGNRPLSKVNVQEKIQQIRQAKKKSEIKTRKLNWIDKRILVSMGKYKSIKDVPDEVTYKTGDISKQDMDAVKAHLQDKGFKYFMSTEYVLTFVCVILCTTAYVVYLKDNKAKPIADKS